MLVVEDDPDLGDLLKRHLTRLGYPVAVAASGERAWAMLEHDPADLVFVDLLMPGIDGRELIRRIQGEPRTRGCRVVIASIVDPDEHGVVPDAILPKPFTRGDVASAIDRAVAHDRSAGGTA